MEHKNVAVMGELGAPSSDGFGANPDTREIRIFDEDGAAVYAKRASDTSKSADAHIRDAGYTRVGEWDSGVAPVRRTNGFKRSLPTIIGVLIAVLLFAGCQAVFNGSDEPDDPTEYDAIYYCKEFVKDQLKSPSTAKFSSESASGGGSSWTSTGVVESGNSFGGMVQSRYTCSLTYSSSDESWKGRVSLD